MYMYICVYVSMYICNFFSLSGMGKGFTNSEELLSSYRLLYKLVVFEVQ